MSHFTTVKAVIRDRALLENSLRELHCRFQSGERILIRGYGNNREYGQVVVDTGSPYDIGFQLQGDESYSVCADWWGVQKDTKIREEQFLKDINRSYSRCAIKKQVLEQGFIVERETVMANGEIELVICEPI